MPGRSGTSGERDSVLTASARSLPPLACGSTEGGVPNVTCVSPAITDWIASAPPRYGTCVICASVSCMKSAAPRCGAEPLPELEKLSLPGSFLAVAISSCSERMPVAAGADRNRQEGSGQAQLL